MKKWTFRQILKVLNNYVVFFLTVGFAVSCCMILFLNILADSMGLQFDASNIAVAAKLTFGNVLLITFLFGTADFIRRKITVDRPVKQITEAAEKIMQGDFSVRVPSIHGAGTEGFNEIGKAINKMAEELSGTETLRTDFIANVSHELKTPLAVMGNYATMLQRPGITEEEKNEYAKAISEAARRLAQLITNILKLNKLENQQIFPQTQEFDLGEQLCESLLGFEDAWEAKNLEIETDIEDGVRIKSDPELLSLVWNNLISNAVKFTPDGGTIGLSLKTEGSSVIVQVRDTGCGMKPETGMHIFEKFYQGDTSHATQGNGLGLALVKRVMDILNGEIGVQSVYGEGSTFTVKFKR
ncbi:MAG: HAMP domain-containing histidine kinase [Oscillospiraceae bacterium]|nr:HAMP domain-containing histidine kinase [Oscillospiraceae bacterium]MBQ3542489.1 HAMP domain-containing histidine kinase [Oscillospiraceae bacterium]